MNKLFLCTVILSLALMSCNSEHEKPQVDLEAEIGNIETLLEQYVVANMEQDVDLITKIWKNEEDIISIGTDSDERLVGWIHIEKAMRNQFQSFNETFISVSNQIIRVNETGNTAWFSESLKYNFIYQEEAMSFAEIRFTGVLQKIEDEWLLVQGHLSIPAEVEMNEVY